MKEYYERGCTRSNLASKRNLMTESGPFSGIDAFVTITELKIFDCDRVSFRSVHETKVMD